MDIDAFILIGGRSSRLGTDKAFVELDGQTLAKRAANTIEAALSPQHMTFVAASDTQFADRLPFALNYPIVSDLKPGFGAWSGLDTALGYARTDWTLILACDLPFVTPHLLQTLAAKTAKNVDAVVPRQPDARLQPLCAFYRTEKARKAVESIFTGRQSPPKLATLFDHLVSHIVEGDQYEHLTGSERFFANINTEKDLSAAKNGLT